MKRLGSRRSEEKRGKKKVLILFVACRTAMKRVAPTCDIAPDGLCQGECLWLQARFFERRLYGVEAVLISSGKREI